jgi:hypothetical protein
MCLLLISFAFFYQIFFSDVEMIHKKTSYHTYFIDESVKIIECNFISCVSSNYGGAIHIDSSSFLIITDSLFYCCTCKIKGGAFCVVVESFHSNFRNCFIRCQSGNKNTNDGSATFAEATNSLNSSLLSAIECPKFPSTSWFSVLFFGKGHVRSSKINVSSSNVKSVSGLVHNSPKSTEMFFINSIRNIGGEAIGFSHDKIDSEVLHGNIINCSSKKGVFYVHDSDIIIKHFFIWNVSYPICNTVAPGEIHFYNCIFDNDLQVKGDGFGEATKCITLASKYEPISYEIKKNFECSFIRGKKFLSISHLLLISLGIFFLITPENNIDKLPFALK